MSCTCSNRFCDDLIDGLDVRVVHAIADAVDNGETREAADEQLGEENGGS